VSLVVGVLTALFSTLIGLFLGLVAGYMGGIADEAIMRTADLFLVIPTLPLFIILVVALSMVTRGMVSMWNIILVLTLFGWMGFARTVRSMVLSLRERTFIEAARASGASSFYIINRHVLPNVFALVYITLATAVPGAIVTEASLSWLGLGDPQIASWGKLLYDFESSGVAITRGLTDYWFWMFPACIAIALLATAFILMGFALDETLNPRLRQRR
jgi:peptide/nickel transport system permease protein